MNRLSSSRARDILSLAKGVRILVVGDLMLDRYLIGSVDRISPEAPVPVVRVEREDWALGGAGNVAANVRALGASCEVVGCLGEDTEGRILENQLQRLGVGIDGVRVVPGRPTTVKTRIMARHQHVTRLDREDISDIPQAVAGELVRSVGRAMEGATGVVLEDYNKGVLVSHLIRGTLDRAGQAGIPSVVDPKRLRFFEFGGATVFKPNARELEDALGERLSPDDPQWMEGVRVRLGCETLLVTLGEKGMALQGLGSGHLRIPAVARDVFDVSGAGDTVTAVLSVALATGASPEEAAILANHAAAVEVGKAGVATVTSREILQQQASIHGEEQE